MYLISPALEQSLTVLKNAYLLIVSSPPSKVSRNPLTSSHVCKLSLGSTGQAAVGVIPCSSDNKAFFSSKLVSQTLAYCALGIWTSLSSVRTLLKTFSEVKCVPQKYWNFYVMNFFVQSRLYLMKFCATGTY